jgi:hypothetical protein
LFFIPIQGYVTYYIHAHYYALDYTLDIPLQRRPCCFGGISLPAHCASSSMKSTSFFLAAGTARGTAGGVAGGRAEGADGGEGIDFGDKETGTEETDVVETDVVDTCLEDTCLKDARFEEVGTLGVVGGVVGGERVGTGLERTGVIAAVARALTAILKSLQWPGIVILHTLKSSSSNSAQTTRVLYPF